MCFVLGSWAGGEEKTQGQIRDRAGPNFMQFAVRRVSSVPPGIQVRAALKPFPSTPTEDTHGGAGPFTFLKDRPALQLSGPLPAEGPEPAQDPSPSPVQTGPWASLRVHTRSGKGALIKNEPGGSITGFILILCFVLPFGT